MQPVPKKESGDSIFDAYFYRFFSRYFFSPLFLKTSLTANQITFWSLIVTLIGGILILMNYWWGLVGLLLFNLGNILDLSDGEVARIKNQSSEFGNWFDSVLDRIKFAFIIFAVGFKGYLVSNDPSYLLITIFAVFNITMVGLLTMIKEHVSFGVSTGSITKNKKVFVGGGALVIVIATFSVLLKLYWLTIWFFAIIGMLMWIKQIINHIENAREKKII